jgi:hypothetical protein
MVGWLGTGAIGKYGSNIFLINRICVNCMIKSTTQPWQYRGKHTVQFSLREKILSALLLPVYISQTYFALYHKYMWFGIPNNPLKYKLV